MAASEQSAGRVARIVVMILLIVQVGITHHHAYGAILMIAIGGAMVLADRDSSLPSFLFVVWLVYFAYVWIWQPVANADQIHPTSLILAAVWATAVASLVAARAAQRGTMRGQHFGNTGASPPTNHRVGRRKVTLLAQS